MEYQMRSEIVFRQWFGLGVVIHVVLQICVGEVYTWLGPTWLWLVLIPLGGLILLRLPDIRHWRRPQAWAWRYSGAPQAIRRRVITPR
jgi:hypothetical protein